MRLCVICGVSIEGAHKLAQVCSPACKKVVLKANNAAYRARHPERLNERARKFRAENREMVRQWGRDCYYRDIEKSRRLNREGAKRMRETKPELLREQRRLSYSRNREKYLDQQKLKSALERAALKLIRELEIKGMEALL